MGRLSEKLILSGLFGGLGLTSFLIVRKLNEYDTSFAEAVVIVLNMYRNQIVMLILTILAVMLTAYYFKKNTFHKEKVSLNCTKKVSLDEYEKNKKVLTEQAVKKLMESEAYKKYVEDKQNNRLRDVQLDESDKIVLSDDSSVGEEEKDLKRQ